MKKLENKVAVITGGTSGMALATAKLFVQEGAYVFITGRDKERLAAAVKEIGALSKNVTGVAADSAKLSDLDKLYEVVKKEKGGIDVLFASAGRGELKTLAQADEKHFDEIFDLNVKGTFFTVQKALPLLRQNASIILNGSIASISGFPPFGVYNASKAAVRSFARSWTADLKDKGIRVNVISPGPIDTPLLSGVDKDVIDAFRAAVPRGTLGRPEEIATVALFFASNDSSFVSGQELFVDGGLKSI
jgi:NAD(P)-dependent dehydrogenase (short-subunit alcohol dehydrogenase family)